MARTGERIRDSFQVGDRQCVWPSPALVPQTQVPVLSRFPRPRCTVVAGFTVDVLLCFGPPNTGGHRGFSLVLLSFSAGSWGVGKPFPCLVETFTIAHMASSSSSLPFCKLQAVCGVHPQALPSGL